MSNDIDEMLSSAPEGFILVKKDDGKWYSITQEPFEETNPHEKPSDAVRKAIDSVTRSAPVPETAPENFWQDAGSGK